MLTLRALPRNLGSRLGLFGTALLLSACSAENDSQNTLPGAAGFSGGVAGSSGAAGFSGGLSTVPVGDDGCAAISQPATNRLQPADIIFAVDNSGSMSEEIAFVREQLNAFSQQIVSSGVDARIILISAPFDPDMGSSAMTDEDDEDNGICIGAPLGSGNCPNDSNPPRYTHVAEEVGSSDALNLFIDTYPEWRDQLRDNATKTFVVVTDDDATDGPNDSAAKFTASLANLDAQRFAKWSFSGIYCFSECPDAAEIGLVYMDLVAQQGGVAGDLCLQNFAPVFDQLAKAVVASSGVDCVWDIPSPPPGQALDPRKVNVQLTLTGGATQTLPYASSPAACGPQGGFYYDVPTAPTQVKACPSTCAMLSNDLGADIDVLFGCTTRGMPD